ncbi:Detected protein of confused Function [Hibiscus syriacus]|uniref:Detected protein of confused Function n=1 Tax=Hibiscus syriacus TaxID=106335 RepID=A0A6A3B5Y5_HIBSY|nr:Detected protein of confused Function [Hibiscus syriacus]
MPIRSISIFDSSVQMMVILDIVLEWLRLGLSSYLYWLRVRGAYRSHDNQKGTYGYLQPLCYAYWSWESNEICSANLIVCLKFGTGFALSIVIMQLQNGYKIRKDELFGTKTPAPKRKGMHQPKQFQNTGRITCDAVEEAALTAAYLIAEAENKSFLAAEAVTEAERVSKMAEDTDSLLQLAKEIFKTSDPILISNGIRGGRVVGCPNTRLRATSIEDLRYELPSIRLDPTTIRLRALRSTN